MRDEFLLIEFPLILLIWLDLSKILNTPPLPSSPPISQRSYKRISWDPLDELKDFNTWEKKQKK